MQSTTISISSPSTSAFMSPFFSSVVFSLPCLFSMSLRSLSLSRTADGWMKERTPEDFFALSKLAHFRPILRPLIYPLQGNKEKRCRRRKRGTISRSSGSHIKREGEEKREFFTGCFLFLSDQIIPSPKSLLRGKNSSVSLPSPVTHYARILCRQIK